MTRGRRTHGRFTGLPKSEPLGLKVWLQGIATILGLVFGLAALFALFWPLGVLGMIAYLYWMFRSETGYREPYDDATMDDIDM